MPREIPRILIRGDFNLVFFGVITPSSFAAMKKSYIPLGDFAERGELSIDVKYAMTYEEFDSRLRECAYVTTFNLLNYNSHSPALDVKKIAMSLSLKFPGIASVNFCNSLISDSIIIIFATQLKNLKIVKLSSCKKITSNALMSLSENCADLKEVDFSSTRICDVGIKELSRRCRGITKAALAETRITDDGAIDFVSNLPNLKELNFASTNITDSTLDAIAQYHPDLESISLSSTQVTERGLAKLFMNCRKLKNIDLSDLPITDATIKLLVQHCSGIEELMLGNEDELRPQNITNASAEMLALSYSNLQRILLQETLMDKDGFALLQKTCGNFNLIA